MEPFLHSIYLLVFVFKTIGWVCFFVKSNFFSEPFWISCSILASYSSMYVKSWKYVYSSGSLP